MDTKEVLSVEKRLEQLEEQAGLRKFKKRKQTKQEERNDVFACFGIVGCIIACICISLWWECRISALAAFGYFWVAAAISSLFLLAVHACVGAGCYCRF
jgi:hypothetical protein